MKLSTFEILSGNKWCDEVFSIKDLYPAKKRNIFYKFFDSQIVAVDPPDFYADKSDIENMDLLSSKFGYQMSVGGFELSEVFLAYLENVRLQINESSQAPVFLTRNIALAESVYNKKVWEMFFSSGNYLDGNIFRQINLPWTTNGTRTNLSVKIHLDPEPDGFIKEPCFLVGNSNNYFHWITESISRLWCLDILSGLDNITLLVPDNPKPFIYETLRALKLDKNKLVPLRGKMLVAEQLYFATYLAPCAFSKKQIEWVQQRLMHAFEIGIKNKGTKRYYISRSDAKFRRTANESEVVEYLKKFNFDVVCPGEMGMREQIKLFSEAEMVVSPHGAGIANILFAPPNAVLIELLPKSYQHLACWMVTKLGGKRYGRLICNEVSQNSDIIVDILKLDKIMQQVMVQLK